jgi:hypothetical protein
VWGAVAAAEADHPVALLAADTSTRESAVVRDGTTLHIKDAEDRTVLAVREALEWVSLAEAENSVVLTSVHEDTEGLAWKIALHQDELMKERRAQETSKREHREHRACFEELSLLHTRGSELCHAIVGPPRAKHPSERMQLVTLCHSEVVGELATFCAAVSSSSESVLGRSPSNTARAKVVVSWSPSSRRWRVIA